MLELFAERSKKSNVRHLLHFQLTQMSQDYVEEIAITIMKLAAKLVKRKLFSRKRQSPQSTEESNSPTKSSDNVLKQNSTSEQTTEKREQRVNAEDKSDSDLDNKAGSSSGEENAIEGQIDNGTEIESAVVESSSRPDGGNDVKDENDEIPAHSSILFHFSIFLVWVIVTGLNIPVVLTWARNFR